MELSGAWVLFWCSLVVSSRLLFCSFSRAAVVTLTPAAEYIYRLAIEAPGPYSPASDCFLSVVGNVDSD